MNLRKILVTVLALAMILSSFGMVAFADSALVAGSYDENGNLIETWEELEQTGKIGCGYMVGYTADDFANYDNLEDVPGYGDTTLLNYVDSSITHLVIDGSKVKTIQRSGKAFEGNTTIKSVKMTEGVETICNRAFKSAANLEEVVIADSVTLIEESAFQQSGVKSATIYADVTYENTVYRASGLESVVIEDGVTTITTGMFRDCAALTSVTIPASVNSINEFAFRDCKNLSEVHIYSTELSMDRQAIVKYNGTMEPFAVYAYTGAAKEEVAKLNANNVSKTVIGYAAKIGDEYYQTIDAALTAAESMTGDVTITIINGTYEGNWLVNQKVGQNLTIKGEERGKVILKGSFALNGRADGLSPETLKFENLKFDASSATAAMDFFAGAVGLPALQHTYPHNVTIYNCDFVGNTPVADVVAVRCTSGGEKFFGLTIDGCTADNMHSLIQAMGPIDNLVVNNTVITNSEKAINLGQSTNVTITGNNFSVSEYVVRIGANSTTGVSTTYEITDNTFTTSSDEDAAIVLRGTTKGATINLEENAITVTGTASDIAFDGAFAADYTATINAEHNYWGGDKADISGAQADVVEAVTYYEDAAKTTLSGAVAMIDDKYFATLNDAINSINANYNGILKTINIIDDFEITGNWASLGINVPVIIDGNDHTITFTGMLADNGNYNAFLRVTDSGVKFQNLKLDMSQATSDSTRFRAISAKTGITVSSCTFIGNPAYSGSRAIIFGEGAGYLINSTDVVINGSKFVDWGRGITDNENGEDARSVSIVQNEFENANVAVSASQEITFIANKMDNSWVDLRAYNDPKVPTIRAIQNELETNDYSSDLTLNKIIVDENAFVEAQNEFVIPGEMPEEMEIKLVETTKKGVYDIVVECAEAINQLSTAKITFVNNSKNNDNTAMGYDITGEAPYNYTVEGDTYTFYAVKGSEMTKDALSVKLGQVTFSGYGNIDFVVKETADNNVIVKTLKDEAEYIYAAAGTAGATGELVIDEDAAIDEAIKPETADLTIEVDYVHDVVNNAAAYQKMTIEITGLDLLGEVIRFNLGDDGEYAACGNAASESNVAHNKHTVVVSDKLIEGNSYTVKVYGDGYRTAEYTIRMDNDKTLKFWNNVMTNETKMEEDDTEGTYTNFLAGDILPDEIINVYDLSAVVSYFGENPKANAGYIQYDLNRDGKIDGLDISILLNSWGK